MSWHKQVIIFLLSALPFWLGIYWLLPRLTNSQMATGPALAIIVLVPLSLLLIAAIAYGIHESTGIQGLMARWHLKSMKRSDWIWTLVLLAISITAYLSLGALSNSVNNQLIGINPPAAFSMIHTGTSFFGIPLAGNWWALLAHIGILVINIFGEELWFRGILFPRQKKTFGKHAWWVHGLFYHIWHMFYPWDILRLLPMSLAYGWVIQKTENTWTTIIAHFLFNGIGLISTVSGIIQ